MSPGAPLDPLAKSGRFLRSARTLLAAELAEQATSDVYYAVFHVAQALLASAGACAETHPAVKSSVAKLFVKDGQLPPDFARGFGRLMAKRQLADYAVETPMTMTAALTAARDGVAMLRLMLPVLAQRLPDTAAAIADLTTEIDALASAT